MIVFSRVLAQLVDLLMGFLGIMVTFIYILPFLSDYIGNDIALGILGTIICITLIGGLQYPFLMNAQTIGKAFFSLQVKSADKGREMSLLVMLQRELLCKLASCYMICFPVFMGKAGGHEEATRTCIVHKVKAKV